MNWALLFVILAILALPFILEFTRKPMGMEARENAPGRFAQLPQGVTHYQWMGAGSGKILVCIHGLTTPSFVWKRLAPGLALLGFRVLVYDLYGRGFSDRPAGRQTAEFFITQLDDLLEHEGVADQQLTIMGYSMGGSIAASFVARYPERVERMILLAPAGMRTVSSGLFRFVRDVPILGDWVMLAFYPATLRKGIEEEGEPEISTLQERELDYRGFVPAVLSSLRGMLSERLEDAHGTIADHDVPALAIWGADDAIIPLAAKDLLAEWNPFATQVVIAEAGHGVTYTHAERVMISISEFVGHA